MKGTDTRLDKEFHSAMSIVANNDIVNHICKTKAAEFARNTDQPLVWCRAKDVARQYDDDASHDTLREMFTDWWQLTHNKCGYLFGALPLAVGMPVQVIADHVDRTKAKRIMKGAIGHVVSWHCRSDLDIDPTMSDVYLTELPEVVYVQFYKNKKEHDANARQNELPDWQINDLPPGVYPVHPIRKTWNSHGGMSVTRWQFPLAPAYARTAYSMQGKTVALGIIDLLFSNRTDPTNGYVTFSRFKDADSVLILQPFHLETFQKGQPYEPTLLLDYIERRLAGKDTTDLFRAAKENADQVKKRKEREQKEAKNKKEREARGKRDRSGRDQKGRKQDRKGRDQKGRDQKGRKQDQRSRNIPFADGPRECKHPGCSKKFDTPANLASHQCKCKHNPKN